MSGIRMATRRNSRDATRPWEGPGTRSVPAIVISLLVCGMFALPCVAGQVRTAGGDTLVGDVSVDAEGRVTVAPPAPPEGTPDDAPEAAPENAPEAAGDDAAARPVTERRELALLDVDEVRFGDVALLGDGRPVVQVAGPGRDKRGEATVRLRAGAHRMVLAYAHATGNAELGLTWAGPAGSGVGGEIGAEALARLGGRGEDPAPAGIDREGYRLPEDPEGLRSRLGYTYYTFEAEQPGLAEADRWGLAEPFSVAQRKRSGSTSRIDLRLAGRDDHYALLFDGYLKVPADGEYTFTLGADSPAALYLGAMPAFAARAGEAAGAGGGSGAAAAWRVMLIGAGDGSGAGRVELDTWSDGTLGLSAPGGGAGGEPLRLAVPREAVAELWSAEASADAPDRAGEPGDADSVYVLDRDGKVQRVTGEVLGVEADDGEAGDGGEEGDGEAGVRQLVMRYQGRERRLDLSRVRGVVFAPERRDRSGQAAFHQVVELLNGLALPGRWTGGGEGDPPAPLTFVSSWEQELALPVDTVSRLRTRNGRLVRLTDLDPAAEEVPYFDRVMPHRVNAAFDGGPITLYDGRRYDTGIAVHSLSRLTYALDGGFARLRGKAGLLKPGGTLGDVTLRVHGDGSPLFERDNVTAEAGAVDLDLDVTGVDQLTLEVGFGDGQDVGDRVGWVDMVLVRPGGQP